MPPSVFLRAARALVLALPLALAACGGQAPPEPPPPAPAPFAPAATLANRCASPRTGTDPLLNTRYPDKQGTLADEKAWLRSWIFENYLWYKEVPFTLFKAEDFKTAGDYFGVLKSIELTPSGRARDQFHYYYPTSQWNSLLQGVEFGYGLTWARAPGGLPRTWVASVIEPDSPAAQAGVLRGDQLLAVDQNDFQYGNDSATIARLNAGLFPATAGEAHTLQLQRNGLPLTVTLKAASVASRPVQNVRTFDSASGKVGYLTFNNHNLASEGQLVAAINELKAAKVGALVLDLRYNGGGLLNIASELAYMIAGPNNTDNHWFERMRFNDKRPPGPNTPFYPFTLGYSTKRFELLPYLSLNKVTILTSAGTCSASESIINSLVGIDLDVTLIGARTCGKPYGFYATPNCGNTYFAIELEGVNDKGLGGFADGFEPTCSVADDFTHALGDPAEGMLAAALRHHATHACPAASSGVRLQGRQQAGPMQPVRQPMSEISIREAPR